MVVAPSEPVGKQCIRGSPWQGLPLGHMAPLRAGSLGTLGMGLRLPSLGGPGTTLAARYLLFALWLTLKMGEVALVEGKVLGAAHQELPSILGPRRLRSLIFHPRQGNV